MLAQPSRRLPAASGRKLRAAYNSNFFSLNEKMTTVAENFSSACPLVHPMMGILKKGGYMTTIAKRQNGHVPQTFGKVVDNIFQNSLQDFFNDHFWNGGSMLNGRKAPVNVRETSNSFQIDVIAPGCRKEDFRVEVKDNLLTVTFERTAENAETDETKGWVRNEFIQESFARSFTIDDSIDVGQISGEYKDGILRINLPKNEKAQQQSRQIDIN